MEGKVSIIIVYWGEYEKYLPECLASVQAQTYKNYEVIIVNDVIGLSKARNKGISKATGEYILCLDVDDKIEPTFLEKTIGLDDIVSTAQQEFGDSDRLWNTQKTHPVLSDFMVDNQINCCSLFKKKVWEVAGGFDERLVHGLEDWHFWIKATRAGFTVTVIKDPLFLYRKHGRSLISEVYDNYSKIHREMMSYL